MNRFLETSIPLWAVVAVVGGISVAVFVSFLRLQTGATYEARLVMANASASGQLQFGTWPALSDENFFKTTRERFVQDKVSFLEADLSSMQLSLYKDGARTLRVPILTKGKEGSWWETPAGLYKIETKEPKHFSSFGKVYQPWSMEFQGNFFIHGWPYYPDGTPVASSYSGGCIRLNTDDARAVFEAVLPGTPVLVFEKDFASDGEHFKPKTPIVSAKNYLVADASSGFVFLEQGSKQVVPIASLTKLVSGLVAIEHMNMERDIEITPSMIVQTSKPRLHIGQHLSVFQLLHPLLLESSNEAAFALADAVGRDTFVTFMNEKAQALGMTHSHFVDPAGIEAGNVSTAEDMFYLTRSLYHNRSFLLSLTAGKLAPNLYGAPAFSELQNFNEFSDNPNFFGGKVGESQAAGETIISVFMVPFDSGKRPIVITVLGSTSRRQDVLTLLNYIETIY